MILVPDLVWSGVVGALAGAAVALVTTLLNNRAQNRRHKEQLQHDIQQRTRQLEHDAKQRELQFFHNSEQSRTEREMSLRRDVYLAAAEAIGKLQEFIASYAREDVPESEKLANLQGSIAALNKVHIVGANRTIEAFGASQAAFARSSFLMAEAKLRVMRKNLDIEQLERSFRLLEERRGTILQLARNLSPASPQELIDDLQSRLQEVENELGNTSGLLDNEQNALLRLRMELIQNAVSSTLEVTTTFSHAVLAAREELRLDLDAEAYKQFVERQSRSAQKAFEAFVARISATLGVEGSETPNSETAPGDCGRR